MSRIVINSHKPLCGEVSISGSKNAALPILAACLLVGGKCRLNNIPDLSDIDYMFEILNVLGCDISQSSGLTCVDTSLSKPACVSYNLTGKIRASFLVAGPLLAKFGRARVALPGGCSIGSRPVDLHLKGFSALGAEYTITDGYVDIHCNELKGSKICLDFPSVGATQNIMMAAVLACGETVIENCASEPEIVDLADFLNKSGAIITGAGTDTIIIKGVTSLNPVEHTVISDRIEAGTFMLAASSTGGKIKLNNVERSHLSSVTSKLSEIGISVEYSDRCVYVDGSGRKKAADVKTMPFPGFPTDMQSQIAAMLCCVDGTSMITETVFENRFMYVPELVRMNADIKLEGRTAVICGTDRLDGAEVNATDLRAGAALIIAALNARGKTTINNAEYIKRGYSDLDKKLQNLGVEFAYIK